MRLARPLTITVAGERGEAGLDQLVGQLVQFVLGLDALRVQRSQRLSDGLADREMREVVGRLRQRARRQPRRQRHDPVLDRAVLAHQHHHGALGIEADELDVLEHEVGLARDDDAGPVAEPAEQLARLGQEVLDLPEGGRALDLLGDLGPLVLVDRPHLEHGVDEEAQALLGGQPPGRGVRRRDQPQILEVGHDVAHRSGAQPDAQHAGEVARGDRRAGFEITLDKFSENVLAACVKHREDVFRGFAAIDHVHHLGRKPCAAKRPRLVPGHGEG